MEKTYQPKAKEVVRAWHLMDAEGKTLGRLATEAATYLTGKHKPTYSAHLDSGDYVVIVNVEKVKVTGRKESQKLYRRHSGYPGGYRELTLEQVRVRKPSFILEHAISGMVPDNRLKKVRMARLKLVKGPTHPYQSQIKN